MQIDQAFDEAANFADDVGRGVKKSLVEMIEGLSAYLIARGWMAAGPGWIDPITFEEEGYFAPVLCLLEACRIQIHRDEEVFYNTLEGRRSQLLGVLSARKQGPVPLEQARAGFLFLLERRAIRLIEDS